MTHIFLKLVHSGKMGLDVFGCPQKLLCGRIQETFPKKASEKKASEKRQDSGGSSKMHREATAASDSHHGLSGG